jgi:hypothetical protein
MHEHVFLHPFPTHEKTPHLVQKNNATKNHIENNTPNKRMGIIMRKFFSFGGRKERENGG